MAHLSPPLADKTRATPGLEAFLGSLVSKGQRAWPGVALQPERFLAHLASLVPQEGEPIGYLSNARIEDLYLACACAQGNPRAHQIFESTYFPILAAVGRAFRATPAQTEELRAEVRVTCFLPGAKGPSKLASYNGSGPIDGWLRTVGRYALINIINRDAARREVPIEDREFELAGHSPASEVRRHLDGARATEIVESVLADLSEAQRDLLWEYYFKGRTMQDLAAELGITYPNVSRRLGKITKALRLSLAEHAPAGMTPDEFLDHLRQLYSRIDARISRILAVQNDHDDDDDDDQ